MLKQMDLHEHLHAHAHLHVHFHFHLPLHSLYGSMDIHGYPWISMKHMLWSYMASPLAQAIRPSLYMNLSSRAGTYMPTLVFGCFGFGEQTKNSH